MKSLFTELHLKKRKKVVWYLKSKITVVEIKAAWKACFYFNSNLLNYCFIYLTKSKQAYFVDSYFKNILNQIQILLHMIKNILLLGLYDNFTDHSKFLQMIKKIK